MADTPREAGDTPDDVPYRSQHPGLMKEKPSEAADPADPWDTTESKR